MMKFWVSPLGKVEPVQDYDDIIGFGPRSWKDAYYGGWVRVGPENGVLRVAGFEFGLKRNQQVIRGLVPPDNALELELHPGRRRIPLSPGVFHERDAKDIIRDAQALGFVHRREQRVHVRQYRRRR